MFTGVNRQFHTTSITFRFGLKRNVIEVSLPAGLKPFLNSVLHLLMTMIMTHVTPALSPLAYIPTVCMDLYCDTAEGGGEFFLF